MDINIKYLKDENNNVISPVTSVDSVFTSGGGNLIDFIYPIGSLYMSIDGDFNPNVKFGGTWEQIKDTFIYASGDKHKSLKMHLTMNETGETQEWWQSETGGSEDAIIPYHNHTFTGTAHTHTFTGTAASHSHGFNNPGIGGQAMVLYNKTNFGIAQNEGFVTTTSVSAYNGAIKGYGSIANTSITPKGTNSNTTAGGTISYVGTSGNVTGANMPPYMTAFIWKRTA